MGRERKIIQSKSHKLRKFEVNISLSAHNDKRYILDDGIKDINQRLVFCTIIIIFKRNCQI